MSFRLGLFLPQEGIGQRSRSARLGSQASYLKLREWDTPAEAEFSEFRNQKYDFGTSENCLLIARPPDAKNEDGQPFQAFGVLSTQRGRQDAIASRPIWEQLRKSSNALDIGVPDYDGQPCSRE